MADQQDTKISVRLSKIYIQHVDSPSKKGGPSKIADRCMMTYDSN